MLHRTEAPYVAGRSPALLKLKPLQDADACVLAHLAGRGRHVGRLGALQLRTGAGIEFALGTGFSDAQRKDPPAVGSTVTFTHRGFTADGRATLRRLPARAGALSSVAGNRRCGVRAPRRRSRRAANARRAPASRGRRAASP
jgi:hypothetical protein